MPAAAKHAIAIPFVVASSLSSCLASATSRVTRRWRSSTTSAARWPDLALVPFFASWLEGVVVVDMLAPNDATPGRSDLPARPRLRRQVGRQRDRLPRD